MEKATTSQEEATTSIPSVVECGPIAILFTTAGSAENALCASRELSVESMDGIAIDAMSALRTMSAKVVVASATFGEMS